MARRSHNKMLPWFTQQNSPPKEPSFYSADISVPLQSLPYNHPSAFNPTRPIFLPRRVTSGSFYPRPINNTTNLPRLSTKNQPISPPTIMTLHRRTQTPFFPDASLR